MVQRKEQKLQVLRTYGYVRLSDDDGDKSESNSVTGQKELIRAYLTQHPEFQECGMLVDDGYTGSNFNRPGFQSLLEDAKAGKVQCIVVKDLSRFGRNYLETGEYLEKIFPFLGIRFIAINDYYDSANNNPDDHLIVPVKNLFNEAYCRDISIKVRSQLEVKRQKGDFIGAFAVYGYLKSPENKNKLIIDDYAADIVRDIYRWKLEGTSPKEIADRLNRSGIASPLEYKKSIGLRVMSPFQKNQQAQWSATAVFRILKNPVYIGVMEQGRDTTLSYKVKKRIRKPKEKWAVVENSHQPIISRFDFENVQKVLKLDTRTSPGENRVEPFSGMVYCGDCGASMVHKTVFANNKKYVYYICSAHKADKKICSSHTIQAEVLSEIVLVALKQYIGEVIDLHSILEQAESMKLKEAEAEKIQKRIDKKREEVLYYQKLKMSLYENLTQNLIDRQEYGEFKELYSSKCQEAEKQAEALEEELQHIVNQQNNSGRTWMENFLKYEYISKLDRHIVVSLIEHICIFKEQRVEIKYCWQDEFEWQLDILARVTGSNPAKEVI